MKTKHFIYLLFFLSTPISYIYPQIFWEERPIIVSLPLTCVSNYNAQNAYICGDSGTVLRTTNYGYNWAKVGINGIPANVMLGTIYALNQTTIITARNIRESMLLRIFQQIPETTGRWFSHRQTRL